LDSDLDHSNITVNPGTGIGTGTLQITASQDRAYRYGDCAGAINSPQTIQVNVAGVTPTAPFGSFDTRRLTPREWLARIAVTGWALDNIEVTRVDISREPIAGEPAGLVALGTAVFVSDARPDIQTMFPAYPINIAQVGDTRCSLTSCRMPAVQAHQATAPTSCMRLR